MGHDIVGLDKVFVRRICAGDSLGMPPKTQAFSITTMPRGRNEDTIVLTLKEAEAVAKAILANLAEE